jgi:branched-chain amino acid transport system permease protein
MKDRLDFYNSYNQEHRIFNNRVQRFWAIFGILFSIYTLITLDDVWLFLLTLAMMTTICAWGLNIVSGFAGQISLAHGAFIGIGTYTAFVLGGNIGSSVLSYGLDMVIWLPLSGIVPMLFGILISPVTSKLKGLNLGLFSIGIVYFVLHIFQNFRSVTGGSGLGRKSPDFIFLGFNFENGITVGNLVLNENNLIALFTLMVLTLSGFGVKNISRTKTGRAFFSIRDRDIAAEAIGVDLLRYKGIAYAISSFYAGICGALLFTFTGGVEPNQFNFVYSVTFIAIVIIGGAGTVLGPLFGSFFFILMPSVIQEIIHFFGLFEQSSLLNLAQIERLVFGIFIIVFLIFEPRGLWGIWFRLRNYFKAWPFSY